MWTFSGETADVLWSEVRKAFIGRGKPAWLEGRSGRTTEFRPALLLLKDPRQRWVVRRTPVNPAAVLSEVIWIACGRRDACFVNFWNPALPEFAGTDDIYHGAYGYRLRRAYGFDQLVAAAEALLTNPSSRQVCLSIWDPATDMPRVLGAPRSKDVPCNVFSMVKVRDGRLHWTQIMRSNDLWLGLPVNLVQFTSLQEIVAGWIGCDVGSYHHLADSLHVYEDKWAECCALPAAPAAPANSDDIRLEYRHSISVFGEISRRMETMLSPKAESRDLDGLLPPEDWPEPYRNILRVVLADAMRRKGDPEAACDVMAGCNNALLSMLWQRWFERTEGKRRPASE